MKYREILIFVLLLVILSLISFTQVTFAELSHNDHMYTTAGYFIKEGKNLYQDFAYLQMPYLPYFYGTVYFLTGTNYYLLTARLINCLLLVASALLIYVISQRLSNNYLLSVSLAILFALNETIVRAASQASNYIMPIALALLSLYLFLVSATGARKSSAGLVLAGVALALAVGVRAVYLILALPFFITLISLRSNTQVSSLNFELSNKSSELKTQNSNFPYRLTSLLLPFTTGFAAGLLPILYFVMRDYTSFAFNNLGYHLVNTAWRESTAFTYGMDTAAKMSLAADVLATPDSLGILMSVTFLLISLLFRMPGFAQAPRIDAMGPTLIVLLLASAFLITFVPTPMWPEYFAMPLPFMLLAISALYAVLPPSTRRFAAPVVIILLLPSILYGSQSFLSSTRRIGAVEQWTSLTVHRTAQELHEAIGANNAGQKVATLSPLFAIEAGLPVYKELATGPFLYRVGDLLTEQQRAHFVGTSPETISRVLDSDPPVAILVGFEGELDDPLIQYAELHNYRRLEKSFSGRTLYIQAP